MASFWKKLPQGNCLCLTLRYISVRTWVRSRYLHSNLSSDPEGDINIYSPVKEKIGVWTKQYEDFIGLTEVKSAQHTAEKKFIEVQDMRREIQVQIFDVQAKLKEIHMELDKVVRGEDKYLTLVTQEHAVLQEEKRLLKESQWYEKSEREYFSALSSAVRDSHEKERSQAEKTKYLSVIGSVFGTILGILGSSINSSRRMKEVKKLVLESSGSLKIQELKESLAKYEKELHAVKNDMKNAVGSSSAHYLKLRELQEALKTYQENFKSVINGNLATEKSKIEESKKDIISSLKEQEKRIQKQLTELMNVIERKFTKLNVRGSGGGDMFQEHTVNIVLTSVFTAFLTAVMFKLISGSS